MVDFGLSEEHEALGQTVREFAHEAVAPVTSLLLGEASTDQEAA